MAEIPHLRQQGKMFVNLSAAKQEQVLAHCSHWVAVSRSWIDADYSDDGRYPLSDWYQTGYDNGAFYKDKPIDHMLWGWSGASYIEEIVEYMRGVHDARLPQSEF